MKVKKPTIPELIESLESKAVPEDWHRPHELLKRFSGLSKSTLNAYQKEMESYPEFKEGVIKPTHSVTWINYHVLLLFLKWKEANRYLARKVTPKEFLKRRDDAA